MPEINISSLNFSDLGLPQGHCLVKGKIDISCFNKEICDQLAGWRTTGFIFLLAAFLLIDAGIPLFFRWVLPRLPLMPGAQFLLEPKWQVQALRWLQGKLLLAFAIFALYQVML